MSRSALLRSASMSSAVFFTFRLICTIDDPAQCIILYCMFLASAFVSLDCGSQLLKDCVVKCARADGALITSSNAASTPLQFL